MKPDRRPFFNTNNIIARDSETGQLGAVVQTHQMPVGRTLDLIDALA